MKRDGFKISLWQDKMPDYISKTKVPAKKNFDALIVGGGITGITTALQLQKSGLQCVVAEAHTLCFGTTGGTTAHLNSFLDTAYNKIENKFSEDAARLITKATNQALDLYHSNVEEYNIDCGYEQKDGYLYSQNGFFAQSDQRFSLQIDHPKLKYFLRDIKRLFCVLKLSFLQLVSVSFLFLLKDSPFSSMRCAV